MPFLPLQYLFMVYNLAEKMKIEVYVEWIQNSS